MAAAKFASVKLGAGIVDEARREATVLNRSVGGQIEHWARLGRAVERAPGFTIDRVKAALEGKFNLDDLTAEEQEAYFDLLGGHFDTPSPTADAFFEARRQKGGGVGRDAEGRMVRARPGGGSEVLV